MRSTVTPFAAAPTGAPYIPGRVRKGHGKDLAGSQIVGCRQMQWVTAKTTSKTHRVECCSASTDTASHRAPAVAKKEIKDFKVAVYSTRPYMKAFFEEALLGTFPETKFLTARLDENTALLAAGFDAVCLFVNDQCNKKAVEQLAAVGVKIIALRCAGYDRVDVNEAHAQGIKVVRVPTYAPESVAEHALAMLMALNRKLHLAYNRVWQGNYTLSGLVGTEMNKKVVGVVGTGAIGTCFCSIMKGFGCEVLAYDLYPNQRCIDMGVKYVSLDELLDRADAVSLHCPLTPDTFHLINKERLVRMKPTALLVNVSRGGLVDTDALLDALENGDVGGCAMDVYENEGNLFFNDFTAFAPAEQVKNWDRRFAVLKSYPNVLITPHSAFLTKEALRNIARTTLENLMAFSIGEHLVNEVRPREAKA